MSSFVRVHHKCRSHREVGHIKYMSEGTHEIPSALKTGVYNN